MTKIMIRLGVLLAVPVAVLGLFWSLNQESQEVALETLQVEEAPFEVTISSTASIQPENRILITPPVRGRIDQVLVKEGDVVKQGDILAWMSSQDRVALIDAARTQGPKEMKKWENIYRKTPIFAPTAGKIVRQTLSEGQTVANTDVVVELSDRLVVIAQVDESDIRQVGIGQWARIRLDAFPGVNFVARVNRVSHQSQVVGGVNVFQVTLIPHTEVAQLKSGLTASSYFIIHRSDKAKLAPSWIAQGRENSKAQLLVRSANGQTEEREILFGRSNGEKIEILSDLASTDSILFRPLNLQPKTKGLNFLNRKQK